MSPPSPPSRASPPSCSWSDLCLSPMRICLVSWDGRGNVGDDVSWIKMNVFNYIYNNPIRSQWPPDPPPPVVRSVKRVGLRQRSRAQPSSTPVSAAALPSIDSVAAFLVHAPRSALANANPVPPRHTVTHTLVVVAPCFTSSQFMFL
jgi:hypothetical protein